jgi:hypothetical protein
MPLSKPSWPRTGPCTLTAGGDHYSDCQTIANHFWPPDRVSGTFLSLVLLALVNVDLAELINFYCESYMFTFLLMQCNTEKKKKKKKRVNIIVLQYPLK